MLAAVSDSTTQAAKIPTPVQSSCRVVQLGQHLPRGRRTMAIPLVAEAIACAVPTILARNGIAATMGIVTGGVALVLADVTLRTNPEAARPLRRLLWLFNELRCNLTARHLRKGPVQSSCRVVQLGQHLPRGRRTMAIPLVAEAIA